MHKVHQHRTARTGMEAITLLSDRVFPRHSHDQFGIGLLYGGGHRSWSGIGPVEAVSGDVITVNADEMHDGAPMKQEPRSWRMLFFDRPLIMMLASDEVRSVEFNKPAFRDPELAALFARLFAEITASSPDLLRLDELLSRTLTQALTLKSFSSRASNNAPSSVSRALDLLRSAPRKSPSLADLAALSGGISRYQFLRLFAKHVGTTPHAFLLQRRVIIARQLLASGLSPAEAALSAGFADQSHLTRTFVRQLGVTPARYRAAVA